MAPPGDEASDWGRSSSQCGSKPGRPTGQPRSPSPQPQQAPDPAVLEGETGSRGCPYLPPPPRGPRASSYAPPPSPPAPIWPPRKEGLHSLPLYHWPPSSRRPWIRPGPQDLLCPPMTAYPLTSDPGTHPAGLCTSCGRGPLPRLLSSCCLPPPHGLSPGPSVPLSAPFSARVHVVCVRGVSARACHMCAVPTCIDVPAQVCLVCVPARMSVCVYAGLPCAWVHSYVHMCMYPCVSVCRCALCTRAFSCSCACM